MHVRTACLLLLMVAPAAVRAQETITLGPSKDNTLFEHAEGTLSNGAGEHLFAGTTNSSAKRRGLLAFDLSSIPAGSSIQSASLVLSMSRSISGSQTVRLHRVTSDWGEGTSAASGEEGGGAVATANSATWIHTFFDSQTWQTPGGDFAADASASVSVGDPGSYTWNSETLAADVQQWLDEPATNFGWILIGNEAGNASAKRFDTREHPSSPPALTITYTTSTAAERYRLPYTARLGDNYPEPAVASTTIPVELDEPGHVVIHLYDVLGRRIRTLADGTMASGRHFVDVSTAGLAAGIYTYCEGSGTDCRRLVVTW